MNNFVEKYLTRLKIKENPKANLSFLKKLHTQHLLNIPFENLNIHYGIKIETTKIALEKKILDNNRGGFCYELNGAFSFLLKEIGFDVTLLSARVINEKGIAGAEFDHLTLLVKLEEGHFLVDVGFGEAFFEPLKFELDEIQIQFGRAFKVIQLQENQFKLLKSDDCKSFSDKYLFSLTPRRLSDFEGMCNFHQTSPDSTFTNKVICTKAIPTGRISLTDSKFIETKNSIKIESEIQNENEFKKLLKQKFEIEINLNEINPPSAFNCRVYGILTQQNQILISREKYGEIEIMKFPGGGIELGESPEEALIREFQEEANAKIKVDEFIHTSKNFHKSVFNGTQLISLYWKVSLCKDEKITTHTELVPTGEKPNSFYQLFWANIFDLKEDFFTFNTEKEVFKKLRKSFTKVIK